jgi:site-specific DNA-cytosine methylase
VLGEVRPRYAFVENVPALATRGLTRVLSDLTALGMDTRWCCLGADDVGAPHVRKRLWILATHPLSDPLRQQPGRRSGADRASTPQPGNNGAAADVADAECGGRCRVYEWEQPGYLATNPRGSRANEPWGSTPTDHGRRVSREGTKSRTARSPLSAPCGTDGAVHPYCAHYAVCWDPTRCADPNACWLARHPEHAPEVGNAQSQYEHGSRTASWAARRDESPDAAGRKFESDFGVLAYELATELGSPWATEPPDVPRVARDIAQRTQRLKALGNGQVPLCAAVAWQILTADKGEFSDAS